MTHFEQRLMHLKSAYHEADAVLIGARAGLSAAAGLTYSGQRFQDNFSDYIARYQMTDMYSAGFYSFKTQEAKWGYWSRHISVNRLSPKALPIYDGLKSLVVEKDYFVVTTNVDGQFSKANFDTSRVFETQGDYGKFQCARPCHNRLYDNQQ